MSTFVRKSTAGFWCGLARKGLSKLFSQLARLWVVLTVGLFFGSSPAYATDNVIILPSDKRYLTASKYLIQMVKDSLKDAESARIGQMIVCTFSEEIKVGIVQVNAKNSYGAYTGYTTMLPFEAPEVKQVLTVRTNPYGAEQFNEQRAILKLLNSCDPVIRAYDMARKGSAK